MDVPDLELRAMVVHQSIRMEDVERPDFEVDVLLEAGDRRSWPLEPCNEEEPGAKNPHGVVAVPVLAPLIRDCTTRPVGRWVMRTADSVLLTCCPPAATRNVDAEIGGSDVHGDRIVDHRIDEHRRERGVTALAASYGEMRTSRCTPPRP
jgi:hypothetical protein